MLATRAKTSIAKSLCRTPIAEGFAMIEAAESNKRIVQIGSQRVSSALCRKAREMYRQGAIGNIEIGRTDAGTQQPNRRLGVSSAARSFSRKSGMGYLAERHAQNSPSIRTVLPAGAAGESTVLAWRRLMVHLVSGMLLYPGLERGSSFCSIVGRHLPLQRWPRHAGPADGSFRLSRNSCLYSFGPKRGDTGTGPLYGAQRTFSNDWHRLRYLPQAGIDTSQVITQTASPRKCARVCR